MPNATVTLATTTLLGRVDPSDRAVSLLSTANVVPGQFLFVQSELMKMVSLGLGTSVNVLRGQQGTCACGHASQAPVYLGRGDQFYAADPKGLPPNELPVYPYINILTGDLWAAQGDESGTGLDQRIWAKIVTAQTIGPLGVRQNVAVTPS